MTPCKHLHRKVIDPKTNVLRCNDCGIALSPIPPAKLEAGLKDGSITAYQAPAVAEKPST